MNRDRLGLAAAIALPLLVLHRGVLAGGVYFQRDVQLMWLEGTQAVARALAAREMPSWDPLVGFGTPLLADPNHQVFYPLAWPGLLLPPARAYILLVLVHHALLAWGLARVARELGLSRGAQALAGAIGAAIGPVVSLVTVWNQLCGATWIPWSVVACRAARRSPRAVAAWAGCAALAVLAGSPESALAIALLTLATAVADGERRRSALRAWLCAMALGAALSAVQWAPTLAAARASARAELPAAARLALSLPSAMWPGLAAPALLAELVPSPSERYALLGAWEPLLASAYLGAPALVLALAGLGSRRRSVLLLAAGAALALLTALGAHGPFAILAGAPGVAWLRYPSKAVVLAGLAVPLLAAVGWQRWRDGARLGWWAAAGLAVVAAAALTSRQWSGLVLTLATASLVLPPRPPVAWRAIAVAALTVADLVLAARAVTVAAPPVLLAERPPLLDAIRGPARLYAFDYFVPGASQSRLGTSQPYALTAAPAGWPREAAQALAVRRSLYPPTAALYGIAGSFEIDVPGLASRRVDELRQLVVDRSDRPGEVLRLLRIAGVTHVAARHPLAPGLAEVARDESLLAPPARLLSVPATLERVRLLPSARHGGGAEALLHPAFDPVGEVLLETEPSRAAPEGFEGSVRVDGAGPSALVIRSDGSHEGYVVVSQAWDAGWSADVDGAPARVLHANHAFMAVAVSAGRHVVTLRYAAPGLAAGAVVTGLGLVAAACFAARRVSA